MGINTGEVVAGDAAARSANRDRRRGQRRRPARGGGAARGDPAGRRDACAWSATDVTAEPVERCPEGQGRARAGLAARPAVEGTVGRRQRPLEAPLVGRQPAATPPRRRVQRGGRRADLPPVHHPGRGRRGQVPARRRVRASLGDQAQVATAAAWPTAMGSPIGRWPRPSGTAPGSRRATHRTLLRPGCGGHGRRGGRRSGRRDRGQPPGRGGPDACAGRDLLGHSPHVRGAGPPAAAGPGVRRHPLGRAHLPGPHRPHRRLDPGCADPAHRHGPAELLEMRPAWGGGKRSATTIQLEPLSEVESDELVGKLLGRAELPDANSRTQISRAAEGNPLFVEEMLGKLIDDGFLVTRATVVGHRRPAPAGHPAHASRRCSRRGWTGSAARNGRSSSGPRSRARSSTGAP